MFSYNNRKRTHLADLIKYKSKELFTIIHTCPQSQKTFIM